MVVTELKENQIFVFGSNFQGAHGAGAARDAMKWGAKMGVPMGPQGQTYAIVTKDLRDGSFVGWDYVSIQLMCLDHYALAHPDREFLLTPIGTGLAGANIKDLEEAVAHTLTATNIIDVWR